MKRKCDYQDCKDYLSRPQCTTAENTSCPYYFTLKARKSFQAEALSRRQVDAAGETEPLGIGAAVEEDMARVLHG